MRHTAIVTGASRGIGRGIALELARLGYDLLLTYLNNTKAAQETAAACLAMAQRAKQNIQIEIYPADLGKQESRAGIIAFARTLFDHLDLLVNNAGIAPLERADILDASVESFHHVLAVNLEGPYFLTQLAARWMIETAETQRAEKRSSRIVFISSISAYTASINRGEYCVAKAGVSMATQLYASRLAEYGINVYEIRPGLIATDMTAPVKAKYDQLIREGLTPLPRWGAPDDVARAVSAIASGLLPFSTGEVINVDGGFHIRRL